MKATSAVAFACLLLANSAFAQQVPAHANPPGFKEIGHLAKTVRHPTDASAAQPTEASPTPPRYWGDKSHIFI